MKTSLSSALAAAIVFSTALLAPHASAQAYPNGTWQQSCRHINLNGSQLTATCQTGSGGWQRSSIDASSCRGNNVENQNGNLVCQYGMRDFNGNYRGNGNGSYRDSGNSYTGAMPGGSWTESCSNAHLRGNLLRATCSADDGNQRWSTLDLSTCRRPNVVNENGYLRCRRY